jgi:heat-inducible transcriptional repressor
MYDLTQRQIEILKQIVKEYIDTANPVGSETLEKKYVVGVSPATIRNEMAAMVKKGYLAKPHTSAGRIPTSKAMRLYVNELMKEKDLSVAEEVEAKEKVWDVREKEGEFMRTATQRLADKTGTLAVARNDTGDIFCSGYSHILDMPEFYDIDVTKNLLNLLDNSTYFDTIFGNIHEKFSVILGEDLELELFKPYSFVFSKFHTKGNHDGAIGVIGPARLRYEHIVPLVRYYGSLVEEVAGW